MKITYLVNEQQADGSLVLVETTSAHWHRIVAANKTAPANERRYFYADILSDNYNLDCIVMEVSKEQHAAWNSERRSARRNRDAAKAYTVLSLDELMESHSAVLPSAESQEEAIISSVVIDELKKALSSWNTWGIEVLGIYLSGKSSIHSILHPVFRLAVRDEYIRTNPTEGAMSEIKRAYDWEKTKRIALTIPEQEMLVDFLNTSKTYCRWKPLVTLFLGTGCRVGEIIGLRWEDCDFENKTISINHNTIYRKFEGESESRFHITTPKTKAGIRTIPMLSDVKEALLTEYNLQQQIGFCDEMIDGYSGFIFQNRFGSLLNSHDINRALERIYTACNEAEREWAKEEKRPPVLIRHFSVHNLRHTFCTRFCENENNLKVIQEIMGHADIETTMNIYAEATTEKKVESFANLEGKIKIS